jgi:hypothetical protein
MPAAPRRAFREPSVREAPRRRHLAPRVSGPCSPPFSLCVYVASDHPCPRCVRRVCVPSAGQFGADAGLQTSSCTDQCPAGYFCPVGSVNGTAAACGNATVYCPPASGAPVAVAVGWYSTPDGAAPPATRTGSTACAPGEYCVSGVRLQCPGGSYSELFGQQTCAECPAGACICAGISGVLTWCLVPTPLCEHAL